MSEKWELIGKQGTAIWCGGEIIAQVTEPRVDHGKKRKRAQLIAAAQDLLDAAIETMQTMGTVWGIDGRSDEYIYDEMGSDLAASYFSLREAIAKAQGAA
jgi:hypothetical protein